jgi:hypothetical protein
LYKSSGLDNHLKLCKLHQREPLGLQSVTRLALEQ